MDSWWLDYLPEDCIPVHVRLEKFAASQDLSILGGWAPEDCIPVQIRLEKFAAPRRTFGRLVAGLLRTGFWFRFV